MRYREYVNVEDYDSVKDIVNGHCYVFPKLEGIQGSVWLHENVLQVADNKGQIHMFEEEDNIKESLFTIAFNSVRIIQFLQNHPAFRLYFTWLKPKHIDTYEEEALGRLYITDIVVNERYESNGEVVELAHYIPYNTYFPMLKEAGLEELCVPCIYEDKNIDERDLYFFANTDNYLIKKEQGSGAGVVIKNYFYCDEEGKQVWAKIDSVVYREKTEVGLKKENKDKIEYRVLNDYCTSKFIDNIYKKILLASDKIWQKKLNNVLLRIVFKTLVTHCIFDIIDKYDTNTINFNLLRDLVTNKVKSEKKELFEEKNI